METEASDDGEHERRESGASRGSYVLTERNTFGFLPGPMTGVACPSCFKDQLLRDVIEGGRCNHCGTELEVTLSVAD